MLDCARLLAPVSEDEPSGLVLEYDPAFLSLHETAKGKPERRMGTSVIPAEPPDWTRVEESATALLARTKDLRVATLLVKARLHNAGMLGLCEGIGFIRSLLERHWDTLHPRLDAEDGDDPSMRVNALADLADPEVVVPRLRACELASARGVGRVCVRDLDRGTDADPSAAAATDGQAGSAPPVEQVLAAADRGAMAKMADATVHATEDLSQIETFLRERVGADRIPDFSKLTSLLQLAARALPARLGVEGDASGGTAAPATAADAQLPARGADAFAAARIASRSDVLRALDDICAYYERFEPSSPIPLLLRRSKRLVAMSFMEIVRDLVPDAVPHVEALRGKE